MSSFIVEPKIINQALNVLDWPSLGDHFRGLLERNGYPAEARGFVEPHIGEAMYALNLKSTLGRYGKDAEDTPGTYDEQRGLVKYHHQYVMCSAIQDYKSLCCWLYQCEEDATQGDPFLAAWEMIRNQAAHHLVSRLPEYDKALWG